MAKIDMLGRGEFLGSIARLRNFMYNQSFRSNSGSRIGLRARHENLRIVGSRRRAEFGVEALTAGVGLGV